MSGPQENLRVLQSYEAEYARRVAFAEEGFRDPKVLAGDWGCKSILEALNPSDQNISYRYEKILVKGK